MSRVTLQALMDAPSRTDRSGSYLIRVSTLRHLIGDGMLVLFVATGDGRSLALQASRVLLRQVVSWRHTIVSSNASILSPVILPTTYKLLGYILA